MSTCNSWGSFVTDFTFKSHKGASTARVHGVSLVKILNKCILSTLVYNIFLDRQCTISIQRYLGCFLEIEIEIHLFYKLRLIGRNNRL